MAQNPVSDLLMELLTNSKAAGLPMKPSRGLKGYLAERASAEPDLESLAAANVDLHPTVFNPSSRNLPPPMEPDPNPTEMLGATAPMTSSSTPTGPLAIWVHTPDGRKSRLDGPFADEAAAYKALDDIMKEAGDTFSQGIRFSIRPDLTPV